MRHDSETATEFHVRLTHADQAVRVEVHSCGAWRLATEVSSQVSASGRGLKLVRAFADDCGIDTSPPSLVAWAEFKIGS
uniref:ATP-binding protein n=1 Tax=Streptomyces triticagri TaxID=2293568 RepID=UPI00389A33E8